MNLSKNVLLSLLLAPLLTGCASAPKAPEIDNSLLAGVTSEARATIEVARADRDRAADAYIQAQADTKRAETGLKASRASLVTVKAQLIESKIAIDVAEAGSPAELESAKRGYAHAQASVEYSKELVEARRREFELAKLEEQLALEQQRLSLAVVEVEKAEALQGVDLVAARNIPIADYWKKAAYHHKEVATARARVEKARVRAQKANKTLEETGRRVKSLE